MGALALEGHADGLDLADLRAGDPDLFLLDQEARVVEDRADEVLVALLLGSAGAHDHEGRGGDERREDPEHAPHGAVTVSSGMTAFGSQFPVTSSSTNGVDPSSAG